MNACMLIREYRIAPYTITIGNTTWLTTQYGKVREIYRTIRNKRST